MAETSEIVELREDVSDSEYYSPDMAPTTLAERKWGLKDIAVLWISMSACIPTYMLASGMIAKGMNWWQAVLIIFLGNTIVLVPTLLNAHVGTKFGIPFPVYCRASFGILGANIPALLRALVACGWFGIQTWIGGFAIYTLLGALLGRQEEWDRLPKDFFGINGVQLGSFLAFWALNMVVVYRGIDSIRFLLNIKAPLLIVLGLMLLAWAYWAANGFDDMLNQPPKKEQFWGAFILELTANVAFWSTLALNIPDFTRYARSQRDQVTGQVLGLPTTMGLFSFIGIAVTSAAFVIYADFSKDDKDKLWDPVVLLRQFQNPVVLVGSMAALSLATLATNIAANVVSPANDFAHVWPKRISFRMGGFITGVMGILIMPWKLLESASVYIDKWLVGYSLLLGAIGGILISDYYFLRRTRLDLAGLYRRVGPYWYSGGFNWCAIFALLVGIGLCVPGFVYQVMTPPKQPVPENLWTDLYRFAWFVSFGAAFVVYVVLMKMRGEAKAD